MSTVFLHVGQAGCQIGEALWPSLFQERPGAGAFLVDKNFSAAERERLGLFFLKKELVGWDQVSTQEC